MKLTHFLAGAAAIVAIAGCNSKQGDAATNQSGPIKAVKPPKGGDWTQIVTATPDGGFMMGNPNAGLHLVEYGSLTCPHCREFDETGAGPLIEKYVKSGQVSYEFRNYVRDAFDLAASLVARCNGAKGFFPLTRALYKDQLNWVGKVQAAPPAELQTLQTLPPQQIGPAAAKLAGFQDWAAVRGLAPAKSAACLVNKAEVDRLVQMNGDATTQYPDFQGTPTFILNGKMLKDTATWPTLEPQLKAALGERG